MTASSTRAVTPVARRSGGDSCPGALRLHDAADGPLARIRIPGGLLTAAQCRALADASRDLADSLLHLTARGNVELRGVTDPESLAAALDAMGLLPSATHERARNIVASPLAGLDGVGACGQAGFAPVVRELDELLVAEPALADLSGRFLFGLDDGRGDVLVLDPDVAVALELGSATSTPSARLVVGGADVGVQLEVSTAPPVLVAAALAFVESGRRTGDTAWRIAEAAEVDAVREAAAQAAVAAGARLSAPPAGRGHAPPPPHGPAPGVVARGDRHAVAASLALGVADVSAWHRLADAAERGDGLVRATPWRGVVVAGLDAHDADAVSSALAEAGLITDPADPWFGLGACTGRPGCRRALADVRSDAASLVASGYAGGALYLSGCERRCGHPRTAHLEVVARDDGRYAVARTETREPPTVVAPSGLAAALEAASASVVDRPAPAAGPTSTPDRPTTKETA